MNGPKVALAVGAVALAVMVAAPAQAGGGENGGKCPAYSAELGCIHPGMVVMGEPHDLPKGWRAYPLSVFHDNYIILPWRYRTRTNFTLGRTKVRKPRQPVR